MKMRAQLFLFLLTASWGFSQEQKQGQVQLPLDTYIKLIQAAQDPGHRPAPVGYAMGNAKVSVQVGTTEPRATAEIRVELSIEVLEDEWVLIPVLPSGTPVDSASVGGKPVQLLATPIGLAWSTKTSGSYTMNLVYRVDATPSAKGFNLAVPVPQAAATQLTAVLPGNNLDVALIPAAGVKVTPSGSSTQVSGTIPTTSGVQISWRHPGLRGHAVSRASYIGRLSGDALLWRSVLDIELFQNEAMMLPLLPRSVTLSDLKVDGATASILTENDWFAALVKGQGAHRVTIEFQVPVHRQDGPPRVNLQIPQVPVSRFEITLPGQKELLVTPNASVQRTTQGKNTVAVVNVPMTNQVAFTWSEAVPEDVRAELRSNATLYHTLYAEEGVLFGRTTVSYEVKRGQTHTIGLVVPEGVQVNQVTSGSGAVADWRITPARGGRPRTLTVFLDRQLRDKLLFDVFFDRSLGPEGQGVRAPLFNAVDVQRQRGMLALLASRDIALAPMGEPEGAGVTRVGENQLPEFVRESIDKTIAHTFKYAEDLPTFLVEATVPERVVGKFDAQVDTLVTLADVTMTGSTSVEVHVKSGGVDALELELPQGVNLLNLTAPSLRDFQTRVENDQQIVTVEFTQEMEGDFRLELSYERILLEDGSEVEVPRLSVRGAEVEQGRIAVEARSAVEVRPRATDQLSPLDISELPQQLILRATNPILLAYKYVHADPPHRLALEVNRHQKLGTQEAVIDKAEYRTLFTRDGLYVTLARFEVKNSRKQFLRVELPEGTEIWSIFVNGRAEQPALSRGDEEGDDGNLGVLIKILNSTQGFPVQMVYATPGARIRTLGRLRASLPQPDILVTRSRWDVYLPAEMRYGAPKSNMDVVRAGEIVAGQEMSARLKELEDSAGSRQVLEPLYINVPTSGIHYAFEKLYANQSGQKAWFSIGYATARGAFLGQIANFLGISLVWLGAWSWWRKDARLKARYAQVISISGLLILVITIGFFHASATLPLVVSAIVGLAFLAANARPRLAQWRRHTAQPVSES